MQNKARKTTPEEIKKLFGFTERHFVEYYDVQTELVDHLANAIEIKWENELEIDFDNALQQEFKKFGVFGFMEIVERRQKAMTQTYFRLIWQEICELLKNPTISLSVFAVIFIFKKVLAFENRYYIYAGFSLVFGLILLGFAIKWKRDLKRKAKTGEKIFLLEKILLNMGGSLQLFLIPVYLYNVFSDGLVADPFWQWILAILIGILFLLGYVVFIQLPNKKDKILKNAIPN